MKRNSSKTDIQEGFDSHRPPENKVLEALEILASEIEKLKGMVIGSVNGSVDHPFLNVEKPMIKKYKLAKLIIPDKKSKDQRWMIKYYVWSDDAQKVVMVRRRDYNDIKDLKVRLFKCQLLVERINIDLKQGGVLNAAALERQEREKEAEAIRKRKEKGKAFISLKEAVSRVIERKSMKSEATVKDYQNIRRHLFNWLDAQEKGNLLLKDFDLEMAREYLHYFTAVRKASNRYHNNIKTYLGTIFRDLELNEYPVKNHFAKIPKLKEGIGRNLAYDAQQQLKIKEVAMRTLPALVPVIETIYYTLMRESELVRMQVKDIYAVSSNKIYLPGSKTKNKQERHIEVTDELAKIFEKMKVKDYPPDYFVFSDNSMTPGPKMYSVAKLGKRYKTNVKQHLPELGNDYTLYSWKHTGVREAKLQGIADANIMAQGGWQDVGAYNKYLKSLGLMDNSAFRENMPKLGEGKSSNR